MNLLKKLYASLDTGRLVYPLAYYIVSLQSLLCWLQSLTKRDRVIFENEYENQPILLCAIFEKGELRKDITRLFRVAKEMGVYVLCVNTKKLRATEQLDGLIDCYIERFNFGRDFGSYKSGFLHIFRRGWEKDCPRLLMVNDSVFYGKKNINNFISEMFSTNKEVLGATENHEHRYHLGSFCISLGNTIINHNRFQRFWYKHRKSDIRPKIIKRGEMGLSKALLSCVTSPGNLASKYDVTWFSELLEDAQKDQCFKILEQTRTSIRVPCPKVSLESLVKSVLKLYILTDRVQTTREVIGGSDLESFCYFVDSHDSLINHIIKTTRETDPKIASRRIIEELKRQLMSCFMRGSQIHQNATMLLSHGLPIAKLDLLYRGMFNESDVENLCSLLDPDEAHEYRLLAYRKPFGGFTLMGWKYSAFFRGLI